MTVYILALDVICVEIEFEFQVLHAVYTSNAIRTHAVCHLGKFCAYLNMVLTITPSIPII